VRAAPEVPAAFVRFRGPIGSALKASAEGERDLLAAMIRHHMGWERNGGAGKALRPTLCLVVCEGLSGRWQPAAQAAAALELVHNFSLIHDDIQDRDVTRRHRPTVWARFGTAQAINAGDALLALAQRTILGTRYSPERHRAAAALAAATARMVEGQVLDLIQEGRLDGGLPTYLAMVSRKTGALMGCALELGAIFAGSPAATAGRLRLAGNAIGMAFQIHDDILGIWGDPELTGKPAASDLRQRKATYPVLALHARRGPASALRAVYRAGRPNPAAVRRLVHELDAAGIRDLSQQQAARYARRARAALRGVRLRPKSGRDLDELIQFVIERTA
jgi:geranylgeranyl diphosphate synthase, type I